MSVASFALFSTGGAEELDPLGPPEPVFPEVVEPTGEPNLDGVENSILLEEELKTEIVTEETSGTEIATGSEVAVVPDVVSEPEIAEVPDVVSELGTVTGPEVISKSEPVVVPEGGAEPEITVVTEIENEKTVENRPEMMTQMARKSRLPLEELRGNRVLWVAQLATGEESEKAGKSSKTGSVQEQENGAEKISASRQLLERLSPVQENYLDGVEMIDLRTFLNSPHLQHNVEAVKEALPTYWEACALRSAVCYWERRADELKKLAETASVADKPLYEAGVAAAQSNLGAAKIALRMNAVELGNKAGYTREVTAKTQPHAGNYETRYDDIRATHGEPSATLTYLNGRLTIHQEQMTAAAAAYSTAEKLLKLQVTQGAGAMAVLAAWDMLDERREVFFESLLEFNRDILNYVLQVSNRRGPELAPLLVRPATEVSLKGNIGRKAPSFPTAPRETVAENKNLPSVVENAGTESLPPPALKTDGVASSEVTPTYAENATVDISPLPETGNTVAGDAVISDNAVISDGGIAPEVGGDEIVVPEIVVPGGELSAPMTETPAPESDFVPIGGETGVDVNPVLSFPAESSGNGESSENGNNSGNGISLENQGVNLPPENKMGEP
ncbi:MAG: hypothetical protein Q4C70_09785, partial [Planctomycetia bacterium]|nr:hypothetical protein [Planctomycetia bacterium]